MEATISRQKQHSVLPKTTHDEEARQEFVRSYKKYLVGHVHGGNREVYEKKLVPEFRKEHGRAPENRQEVAGLMETDPYYRMFSALLRNSQEMMWSSCQMPVQRDLQKINTKVSKTTGKTGGSLKLDSKLEIPRYHRAVDIHCQPGGYHTEYTEDDAAAGAIYDRGVHIYAMGQMGPTNADMGDSVIMWLKERRPDLKPVRILDLGCSVGHSTVPYTKAFPDAEIYAVDVGAPMLRYAHARAEALGAKIHFSQQNAEKLNFRNNYFDVIVSHILLHETSEKALKNIYNECFRLLKKGGVMLHVETPPYQGMEPFDEFMLDWDTRNNNEPFWRRSHEFDHGAICRKAGFAEGADFQGLMPSAFQVADQDRSHVFQGGDFGGGGFWYAYGAQKG